MVECVECEESIDERRLKALPNTKVCVSCQQNRERNGRFQLHVMDVQAKSRCGEVDTLEQTLVRGIN